MGHSYNHGMVTCAKGKTLEDFSFFIGATGAVGAIEQCSAGLVQSVTRTAIGVYTVQLNGPYPPILVDCFTQRSKVVATDAARAVEYSQGSYNNLTGQFIIWVTDATPAAADPINGSKIQVKMAFRRYTTMPA